MTRSRSEPEEAGRKQGRFVKGRSGNPRGRPKGLRNHASRLVETLLDGEAEALTRKAIEKALEGDAVALRLCLERLCPPRKDRPVMFDLPRIESAGDAEKALSAIIASVAAGDLTPGEASEVSSLIGGYVKARETSDLEHRIEALEKEAQNGTRDTR
jgi:hypothetical protein